VRHAVPMNARRWLGLLVALLVIRGGAPTWYGRDARAWFEEDEKALALARELVRFEAEDSVRRATPSGNRFEGEWALVTHQMTALGLGQLLLAHADWKAELAPSMRQAALGEFGECRLANLGDDTRARQTAQHRGE